MLFFIDKDVSRIVLVAGVFGGVQNIWDNGISYLNSMVLIKAFDFYQNLRFSQLVCFIETASSKSFINHHTP